MLSLSILTNQGDLPLDFGESLDELRAKGVEVRVTKMRIDNPEVPLPVAVLHDGTSVRDREFGYEAVIALISELCTGNTA